MPSFIFPIPMIIIHILEEPINILYIPILYPGIVAIVFLFLFIPSFIYSVIFELYVIKIVNINSFTYIVIDAITFPVLVYILSLPIFHLIYPLWIFFIPVILSGEQGMYTFVILFSILLALTGGVSSWLMQRKYKEDLKRE